MSDYNSVQKKLNFIVGSFVLMAILAFVWMIIVFGELPLIVTKHKSFEVFAQFPSAPGIQQNTPVQYCGYRIGKVFKVNPPTRLVHLDSGKTMNQVKVGLAIDEVYENQIPTNVDVRVVTRSMGSSYIEIFDRQEPPAGFISRKVETFQGSVGSSTEFIPKDVQKKLEILIEKITESATDLHVILGDEKNQKNIVIAVENFGLAAAQAQDTLASIRSFSDNGQEAFVSAAEELDGTLKDIRVTLKNINKGDGTVSRLILDPSLHENLLEASRELQIVLEQIKLLAAETREKGVKIAL
jgi:ABC-type transporter Mla subunit MlaD